MSVQLWISELIAGFWERAGQPESFPRSLRAALGLAFPVSIKEQSPLRLSSVLDWLRINEVPFFLDEPDRPLRACLVGFNGGGVVFIEADDAEDEKRFSLAHEIGHFLRDYWQPRQHAARRLGPQVLEVFDGLRPARDEERLGAMLGRVPIGVHTHLLGRDTQGRAGARVTEAEQAADRLAFELLAPAREVFGRLGRKRKRERAVELLQAEFGLPAAQARRYAEMLVPASRTEGWILRLRG